MPDESIAQPTAPVPESKDTEQRKLEDDKDTRHKPNFDDRAILNQEMEDKNAPP